MATSFNKTKNWNIYSTHYSPANSSTTSSQATSSDNDDFQVASSKRASFVSLPYGRQRSVFPYGIVSEYDLKDSGIGADSSDKIHPKKLSCAPPKWSSSPCLASSSTARWGTKILQPSSRISASEEDDLTERMKPRNRRFRERMHSCPSTPVNDFLRIEVPKLSSIMVHAQSVPLVSRPLMPTKLKATSVSTPTTTTRRPRAASVNSFERPKKITIDIESQDKVKETSKSLSEVKIEDGVIIIENGKCIDLRKDKQGIKNHKLKPAKVAKSKSYREFQDAMQKLEDAQLNLEGEVNAKAKTLETRGKEQEFFNEHVQTQFLDLLSSVKEKRKKNRGKKYRC